MPLPDPSRQLSNPICFGFCRRKDLSKVYELGKLNNLSSIKQRVKKGGSAGAASLLASLSFTGLRAVIKT